MYNRSLQPLHILLKGSASLEGGGPACVSCSLRGSARAQRVPALSCLLFTRSLPGLSEHSLIRMPNSVSSPSVMSAAHRCLFVGELLAGIVAQLDRESDMLSMALVSRAFEDVGLNATWYNIGNHKLKRLLSLLPVDLWAQSGDYDSEMVRRPHRARAGRRFH
jgi:hypothetical protein